MEWTARAAPSSPLRWKPVSGSGRTAAPTLTKDAPERARHGSAFLVHHADHDQFWIMGETGDLVLATLKETGYQELGRQHLLEPTNEAWDRKVLWSHPAFALRSVFARNDRELIRVDLSEDK